MGMDETSLNKEASICYSPFMHFECLDFSETKSYWIHFLTLEILVIYKGPYTSSLQCGSQIGNSWNRKKLIE